MIYISKAKLASEEPDTMLKNKLTTIIKLTRQAFGAYKLQIVLLAILGFLTGLLEGIGVNAMIPMISFATKDKSYEIDAISRIIKRIFSFLGINFNLEYLLIFICLLFILKAFTLVFCNYIRIRITATCEAEIRNKLFDKTINAKWPYLLKQKSGYLETLLLVDVMQSTDLLNIIGAGVITLTGLIIYAAIAISISPHVTLFALAIGSILFLFLKPLMSKTKALSQEVAIINKETAHYVNENIAGIKTTKAMLVNNKIIETGKKYFDKLKKIKIKILLLRTITNLLFQPISLIFVSVVFVFAYKTPNFSFATFVPIIYLIYKIFEYIQTLQANLHRTTEAIPFLNNVLGFENEAIRNREKNEGSKSFKFDDDLEFKNVNFSYNADKTVLNNLNFKIKKGEMIGLIGPSGVGKTTIVDLVLRLFSPTQGKILIDKNDISEIDIKEWRKSIGYIPQDIFLMNDTIANNIRFYDDGISNKKIEQTAEKANIYDFIQTLPKKFSAIVGERGVMLSVGQRQRIVIARVLARNPKLLILDEATSALDNESEAKIQEVIENLRGRVTVLVIAHRLSTVTNCDRLLVLEKGEIIEQGIPKELLKNENSYFYKSYNIRK